MPALGAKWIRYGNEKRKLPVPSSATESHAPPSLVLTVAPSWLLVENSRSRVAPGAAYTSRLAGTPPPICTVTVMVCGASTALRSLTVTMPVTVPAGSVEVFKANCSGVQVPDRDAHARGAPTEPAIQETEEVRLRLSEPSAALYASTVCALPLAPCAMETGPTVDDTRRNRGTAPRPAAPRKPAKASAAASFVRPTREHPSYTPRCNRPPKSPGTRPLRLHRTIATGGIGQPKGIRRWSQRRRSQRGWR